MCVLYLSIYSMTYDDLAPEIFMIDNSFCPSINKGLNMVIDNLCSKKVYVMLVRGLKYQTEYG
jgi:hypothetical protein